jgi:hypothetical protein
MHHSDYAHGEAVMRGASLALLVVLSCLSMHAAYAQRYPGHGAEGVSRGTARREGESKPAAGALQEPFAALERELPSLKVDLQIQGEQVAAWSVFERDVRDLAELDRVRKRHLLALRDPEGKPPTALAMIATLEEEDRQKAEASADLKRHFETLYAMLDEPQRRMLDRRVVLSQTEPLGQESPAPRR